MSASEALAFSAVVGIGYLASTTVSTEINPTIPGLLFYGLVSGSYFLVSSLVNQILVVMR